jgi:multiple sugar transport system ATP-binding protein
LFVARFIGSPGMNLVAGTFANGAVQLSGGNVYPVPEQWLRPLTTHLTSNSVILGFRPEAAHIHANGRLRSEVYASDLHGAFNMLHLALGSEADDAIVHVRAERGGRIEMGTNLAFDLDAELVRFFDPQTEQAILLEKR